MRPLLLALVLAGCSATLTPRDPTFAKTDAHVTWTSGVPSADADIGRVIDVAERGSEVLVVGERGARFYRDGVLVATDASSKDPLASAAAVPAADGRGTWLVAVSSKGALLRARDLKALEPAGERYALSRARVLAAASSAAGGVFLLDDGVALAGGGAVSRYDARSAKGLRAGGPVIATWNDEGVVRYEGKLGAPHTYALSGVRDVAVSDAGRVYAAREDGVYAEQGGRSLELVYRPDSGVRALAASGSRIWLLDGARVVVLEASGTSDTVKVELVSGVTAPADARLAGSATGDAWLLDRGTVMRVGLRAPDGHAPPPVDANATWQRDVSPIFARTCAACHNPGGPAGIDLSTPHAWAAHRDEIRKRVVVAKDMPPRDDAKVFPSDAERAQLAKWLE